jgi:hypothetical protein
MRRRAFCQPREKQQREKQQREKQQREKQQRRARPSSVVAAATCAAERWTQLRHIW